jgi:hypothetical protein
VDELIHIPFRAPDSPAVEELRAELLDLSCCHTDRDLLDVALAATLNGKAHWLSRIIETEMASPLAWRRRRGVVLQGFTTGNSLPVVDAWPDREIRTRHEELHRTSARARYTEACANHWWRAYQSAQDRVEGYAAWVLFLYSADRRAWNWIRQEMPSASNPDGSFSLKTAHAQANLASLRRRMKKREDKLDKHFLGQKIFQGFGPWWNNPD